MGFQGAHMLYVYYPVKIKDLFVATNFATQVDEKKRSARLNTHTGCPTFGQSKRYMDAF